MKKKKFDFSKYFFFTLKPQLMTTTNFIIKEKDGNFMSY